MRNFNFFLGLVVAGIVSTIGAPFRVISSAPAAPREDVNRKGVPWEIVCTQLPAHGAANSQSAGDRMLRGSSGGRGRLVLLKRDGSHRVLTEGFESAADPAISFDGKRILFSAKKIAVDRWNIYEMNADGSGVRQITHEMGDCRSPIYQPSIFYLDDPGPMPQIAFVSDAPGTLAEDGSTRATAIYSVRLDGSGLRRLTYLPSGSFDPAMLPDGRILFSGWQRHDLSHGLRGRVELLAANIDGTDYATFSGGQGRAVKQMACVTANRLAIFVEADSASSDGSGQLGILELRRNLHSYRTLPLPATYLYSSPSPLPDGTVLVSRRPADGSGTHRLFRLDPVTAKLEPVFGNPEMDTIQAQALVSRPVPDGRSSVVDEKQSWAKLYGLNVNESDLDTRAWPKGLVRRVRILEGLPRTAQDRAANGELSPLLQKRFLGEIDVDADGSFHAQIPANVPVQIQALDEEGIALRSSAWIWVKNKEQRGCIGCHEDGERTPENIMATALTRPAAMLTLPAGRRRAIEFERDIAPVLTRRCATAACHAGAVQPYLDGKSGQYRQAYDGLLAKPPSGGPYQYVHPGVARTSPVVWAISGRNTSRSWDQVGPEKTVKPMPPSGSPALTAAEKRAIVEWIDLGAHYRGLPSSAGGQR